MSRIISQYVSVILQVGKVKITKIFREVRKKLEILVKYYY